MLLVGVAVTEARGTERGNHVALGLGGAVTLQGKDNISQLKQAEQSENVKTSSFPFVFAHKMTFSNLNS